MSSIIRFLTESAVLGFGLVTGVILARSLGPEGKGALASLAFMVVVSGQLITLGIEEATIILVGQRRFALQRSLSAALPVMLAMAGVGIILLLVLATVLLANEGSMGRAIGLGCLLVPIVGSNFLLTGLLNSQEQIAHTSLARMMARGATLLFLLLFVMNGPLTLAQGVGAEVLGMGIGAVMLLWWITRDGVSLRPTWDPTFLREAIPKGLTIQSAKMIYSIAERVDLLLVLAIVGRAATGQYSVALTVGQLVSHASFALTFAMFPRIASIEDQEEALELIKKALRYGLASSILAASVLVAVVPFALPFLFGHGFAPAIGPALLLIIGGIFWSSQLLLARAWAARGATRIMVRAYGAGLVVMLALDLWLIPSLGIAGAAIASIFGPLTGTLVCIRDYKVALGDRFTVWELWPRPDDFLMLARIPLKIARARQNR